MFMSFLNNPHQNFMYNQSDNGGDDHQTHRHVALHDDDDLVSDSDHYDQDGEEDGGMPQPILSYMGNIAAACDAANAATQKPFRTDVEKQQERRAANRRSAKMSRDRKKMERDQLQEKATRLAQANLALTKENQELRQQILKLTAHQGGGGSDFQKPSNNLSHMPGGLGGGGLATNNSQQGDLFTLQWMQQQAQMDQQDTKRNAASMSMTSNFGFSDLLAPAALVQGSQLAAQTLQMAASVRNQNQQQSMHHVSDTNALALGLAPGGLSRAFESNKRQKSDSDEFDRL